MNNTFALPQEDSDNNENEYACQNTAYNQYTAR